jgi:hypothetical protein
MATATDWTEYESAAKEAANNHARFDSFGWHAAPDDSHLWALVYTHNRDSGTVDRANAEEINKAMAPFEESGDVVFERHSHWACGHVDGFALRVYTATGEITDAFRAYCDLQARLDDYPVLDDETLSRIENDEIEGDWDNWIRADFERQLEKAFDTEWLGDAEQLHEIFRAACDARSEFPYHTGNEVIVRFEEILKGVTHDMVRPFTPEVAVKVFCNGRFLVAGCIQLDTYACDLELYSDEFAACIEAMDNGEQSVRIGGNEFTWQVG